MVTKTASLQNDLQDIRSQSAIGHQYKDSVYTSVSRVVAQGPFKIHGSKLIFSDIIIFDLFYVSGLNTQVTVHLLKSSSLEPIQAPEGSLSFLHRVHYIKMCLFAETAENQIGCHIVSKMAIEKFAEVPDICFPDSKHRTSKRDFFSHLFH